MSQAIKEEVSKLANDFKVKFEGKRILVTGGAGFIGSWVCDVLVEAGADVACLDNFSTGKRENLGHLKGRMRLIEGNIEDAPIDREYEMIFHLASRASPEEYQMHPIETLKANSLGTLRILEKASGDNSTVTYASSSEVYGDAQVIPTPETYYGNVNPVGPRSSYDEGKRFGEALCIAFFKQHNVNVRIARIFNSILPTENVLFLNDNRLHIEPINRAERKISLKLLEGQPVFVPAFDPVDNSVKVFPINAVQKHHYEGDTYVIETTYGRTVKVTGDHSVFARGPSGAPVPIFARLLKKGDHIAIPRRIVLPEYDLNILNVVDTLKLSGKELWKLKITSPKFRQAILERRKEILSFMRRSGHFKKDCKIQVLYGAISRYERSTSLPLAIVRELGVSIPGDATVSMYWGGKQHYIPNKIEVDQDLLWLMGFYLAEGCNSFKLGKTYSINFTSDDYLLDRATSILRRKFNVHVVNQPSKNGRSPAIIVNSWIVRRFFEAMQLFEHRVPTWVFHLPLQKLGYFLEGYKDGDGTHTGKSVGSLLDFSTSSKRMAEDISTILLRFGIVAMVRRYTTAFKQKYGDVRFPFYRISIRGLSTYNILEWHKGVSQKLTASSTNDIVWACVKRVKRRKYSGMVYDFSVPGAENFIAGSGIFCHNTYGPRIREDGYYARALPRFISQALNNTPVTIYGDGLQTRSFCYITDTVSAILSLSLVKGIAGEVFNIGNPEEITILELARRIITITKSSSEIKFLPAQPDDPRRRCPDITKAGELLGWEPRVKFDDGLEKAIEYFASVKMRVSN